MPNVLILPLDVADQASIERAVTAGLARFGRIDVLLNNAGYTQSGLFEAISAERIERQFDVNVFGVMAVTRALLPHMRANGSGTVINVSSGAGLFALPMMSLYCASKFALEGWSEALAYELAAVGIIVKLVIPHGGVTATAFRERQQAEFATDPSLSDYDSFVERTGRAFTHMMAARAMSADDVAEIVLEAAMDGTDRLRYLVGDDARGFVKARMEMSEENYIRFMRERFAA